MTTFARRSAEASREPLLSIRVFAGCALILVALIAPGFYASDGHSMFAVADSLVTDGDLSVACQDGTRGRGGDCYSPYYPLQPVVAVPFVAAGRLVAGLAGVSEEFGGRLFALLVPALAAAGAAAFTAALALRMGARRRAAVGAAAAALLGTELLTHARTFYADPLAAFCVALAAWGYSGPMRLRPAGHAGLVLAVLAKPMMVVVGGGFALAIALHARRPLAGLPAAAATGAGALLTLGYNWLRFADPLDFGGDEPGGGAAGGRELKSSEFEPFDLAEGLATLLISPGRGLIVFSPVIVLGIYALLRRRRELIPLLALLSTAGLLALHSGFPGSGFEWATRYLVPIIPLLCVGLALLGPRAGRVAVALTCVGFAIALPTLPAFYERYPAEARELGIDDETLIWALPPDFMFGMWGAAERQISAAANNDPRQLVDAAGPREGRVSDQETLRVVALWWWLLPVVGIPWWLGAAACGVMIGAGLTLLWRAAGPRAPPV